jgi:hypothetical protein
MPLDLPCGGLPGRPTLKTEFGPTRPSPLGCFGPPGENRRGNSPPPPRRRRLAGEIRPAGRRWSAGKWLESGPRQWWLQFEAKGGGRLTEGRSPRRRVRVGKSHRQQTGEGLEAGVEVDVEVPGTRAVLGVEQVWPEEDWRWRSTVAEARWRWQLKWSGGSSTITREKGVNDFSFGPTVRG